MKMQRIFYKMLSRLWGLFSKDVQRQIIEWILIYTPIFIIRTLPFSYGVYLRCLCPPKGGVVFDCGAHIGIGAILFSRLVGSEGLVICVEAFPDSYAELVRRVEYYGLKNVIAINKGLWNEPTVLSMDAFDDTISCRMTSNPHSKAKKIEEIQIDCVTLDAILSEHKLKRIDLIKMDIEGTEIEALQGASKTITTMRPVFAIASYHKRNGRATYVEVEEILKKYDYNTKTIFPPHLTTCGKPK